MFRWSKAQPKSSIQRILVDIFDAINNKLGDRALVEFTQNIPAEPLKLALGTSGLAISIINTSAAWVYMNEGALLPIVIAPSILGVMLGARVGVRVLRGIRASTARNIVIAVLVLAGLRSLMQGFGF